MTQLTTSDSTITSQIANMVAQGETYIPAGVMWGLRVLSPNAPLADGAPYGSKKIMILMTDGYNTKSQFDTGHEGSDVTAANTVMTQLCDVARSQSIEMYTIAFEVTDNQVKQRLQQCAVDNQHYFDAQSNQALSDAFNKISGSVIKLALSH